MKKRLEYIDALKGLSIILLIAFHSHFIVINFGIDKMLVNMEVPSFFFLSGIFFKRYGCFKEFLIRKVNQLVVPYIFFSYIPFCLFSYFYTDRYADPMFYLLAFVKPWNTPLWFLRCLFFTYLIYYVIDKYTEKRPIWIQMLIICVLVVMAWFFNIEYKKRMDNPFLFEISFFINNITTAFISLPFFFLAQQIKKRGWLNFNLNWTYTLLLAAVGFVLAYHSKQLVHNYWNALYGDNLILSYISSLSSIFAFGILFAKIKYTKPLQFFGRYSLIGLGCQALPIIILIERFPSLAPYEIFIITFLLMIPCIYFFKKFFPKFTAQEELFKST